MLTLYIILAFFVYNEGSSKTLQSSLTLKFFLKSTRSSLTLRDFRKPTSPPLPLREGPPLISVFSPQGRRGNRSSSSLWTISFYGWRTIRGLRQFFMRDGTAGRKLAKKWLCGMGLQTRWMAHCVICWYCHLILHSPISPSFVMQSQLLESWGNASSYQ